MPKRGNQYCRGLVPQQTLPALLGQIQPATSQCHKYAPGMVDETDRPPAQAEILGHLVTIDHDQLDRADPMIEPLQTQR